MSFSACRELPGPRARSACRAERLGGRPSPPPLATAPCWPMQRDTAGAAPASLRAAGRRPKRPLPSGDPTPRRSRARREWRRARDLRSRARRSQWHGLPGSKALPSTASERRRCSSSRRRSPRLGAAVLAAAAAAAAAASRLASVTAALHLAAARPSDGAGASLTGASPPPPPFSRRSARGRRLPCQSRRLPCHPAARTTAATASRLAAAATDRPPLRR